MFIVIDIYTIIYLSIYLYKAWTKFSAQRPWNLWSDSGRKKLGIHFTYFSLGNFKKYAIVHLTHMLRSENCQKEASLFCNTLTRMYLYEEMT